MICDHKVVIMSCLLLFLLAGKVGSCLSDCGHSPSFNVLTY